MESNGNKPLLWAWFAVGFAIVFVTMALCMTIFSMQPYGGNDVACVSFRLWKYYMIELNRQLRPSRLIGPASGGGSGTAHDHVLSRSVLCLGRGNTGRNSANRTQNEGIAQGERAAKRAAPPGPAQPQASPHPNPLPKGEGTGQNSTTRTIRFIPRFSLAGLAATVPFSTAV